MRRPGVRVRKEPPGTGCWVIGSCEQRRRDETFVSLGHVRHWRQAVPGAEGPTGEVSFQPLLRPPVEVKAIVKPSYSSTVFSPILPTGGLQLVNVSNNSW